MKKHIQIKRQSIWMDNYYILGKRFIYESIKWNLKQYPGCFVYHLDFLVPSFDLYATFFPHSDATLSWLM